MFQDPIQLTQNSPSQFDNHDDEFQNFQTIINENDDNFNRLKNYDNFNRFKYGYFALKNANERISKRNAFDKLIKNKQIRKLNRYYKLNQYHKLNMLNQYHKNLYHQIRNIFRSN